MFKTLWRIQESSKYGRVNAAKLFIHPNSLIIMKPKVRIKVLKPKVKITKIMKIVTAKQQEPGEALEEMLELEDSIPVTGVSAEKINPTLEQEFKQPDQQITGLRANAIQQSNDRAREREFSYQNLNQQTTAQGYDPSIRAAGQPTAQQITATRVDPTIQASPLRGMQSNPQDIRRQDLARANDPLRQTRQEERKYEVDNAKQYNEKRRKMM